MVPLPQQHRRHSLRQSSARPARACIKAVEAVASPAEDAALYKLSMYVQCKGQYRNDMRREAHNLNDAMSPAEPLLVVV